MAKNAYFSALFLTAAIFFSFAGTGLVWAETGDYVGYWRLDSASNNVVPDSSHYLNNGTYVNPFGNPAVFSPGKVGNAIKFNGTDYVQVSNLNGISSIKAGLTIAYWVKRTNDGESYHVLKKDAFGSADEAANYLAFWTNHASGQDWLVFSAGNLLPGEWHHVVLTWSAGVKTLYVDGMLVQTYAGRKSDNLINGNDPLYLGNARGWNQINYTGALDEVKIFNRSLSPLEVAALYKPYSYLACAPGSEKDACRICRSDGSGWEDDDSRCAVNRTCFNGVCVKKFACDRTCGDATCSRGQYCEEARCVEDNSVGTMWWSTIKDDEYKYMIHWADSYIPNNYRQIRQKNCEAILLSYITPLTVGVNQTNGFDYNYINNNHPEWFLRNASGGKVHPRIGAYLEESRYLLDIGNESFQNWAADEVVRRLENYTGGTATGTALDNIMLGLMPEFEGKYTQTQWADIWERYLRKIKSKLNSNGYILVGNLGADFKNEKFIPQTDRILNNLDGYMNEGFLSGGSIDWSYRNMSENEWLAEVTNTLWAADHKGKIPFLVSWSYKLPEEDLVYLYGSFLLVGNQKTYFSGSESDSRELIYQGVHYSDFFGYLLDGSKWYSLWDYDLGDPEGLMYKEYGLYQRNYTKARIIVNPSENTLSMPLEGTYYTIGGRAVSSLTLAPKTAEILLTAQCVNHSAKRCYYNDLYWYTSCGLREDLAESCGTDLCASGSCIGTDGMLGRWKLDSAAYWITPDSSPYKSDGNYYDPAGDEPSITAGKDGGAIKFSGRDYVKIGASRGIDEIRSGLTLAYWVRRSSYGEGYDILKQDTFGTENVAQNTYMFYTQHLSGQETVFFSVPTLPLNEWHHIAFTWSAGVKSMYADGSLVESRAGCKNDSLTNTGGPVYLGNSAGWRALNLTGELDEVRLYDHALSGEEIRSLYQSYMVTTTTTSTTSTSSSSTTSTTEPQCAMPGNDPPCGVVELMEVVDAINQWATGTFSLGDVVNLINSWADPSGYPPQ